MIPLIPSPRSPGRSAYVEALESLRKWQKEEPAKWHFIKHAKWKKQKPKYEFNTFEDEIEI